jgi:lipid-A-disaccharide synthase
VALSDEPSSGRLKVAMVAGEASGDLLAGHWLKAMRERWPQVQAYGIGGPVMQSHGFEAWWPSEQLAVRGYIEVLRHYRRIVGIRRSLLAKLLADPPHVFIGVDAPDFNLELERALKAHGVSTVHFISPSIWAWRGERIDKIPAAVDHMLCLFPFEPALYQAKGVAATFVGHPLADVIPMTPQKSRARLALQIDEQTQLVALLPGSRASEIESLAPLMAQTALCLHQQAPQLQFVLPMAPGMEARVNKALQKAGATQLIRCLSGQSHAALAAADVTLIASGTATLEAALFKCPMVITYRMNPISWQMMKRMKYQPWVGLPNILCRDFVVPERLQQEAQPEVLARDVLHWLNHPQEVSAYQARMHDLHTQLRCHTTQKACDVLAELLRLKAIHA